MSVTDTARPSCYRSIFWVVGYSFRSCNPLSGCTVPLQFDLGCLRRLTLLSRFTKAKQAVCCAASIALKTNKHNMLFVFHGSTCLITDWEAQAITSTPHRLTLTRHLAQLYCLLRCKVSVECKGSLALILC